jgi:excisionase family DNA binding protein
MNMSERLMNVSETAALLGRTENAIRRLVERRKIPFRRSGRRILFIERELLAVIEELPGLTLEEVRDREKVGV